MRVSGAIQTLYMKFLMLRNFVAEFHRENASVLGFMSHPLWGLRVTYAVHLKPVGKHVVDFL